MYRSVSRLVCVLISLLFLFAFAHSGFADSQDVKGLSNGSSYYIKNSSGMKYMVGNASTLTTVSLSSFSESNNFIWILERTNNGLYYIKSKANPNRVLTVSGSALIISARNNNNNTNQTFTISRVTTGVEKGTYKIKHGSQYVVRNSNSVSLSGLGAHRNACWCFETSYKGNADMYYFVYPNYSTSGSSNAFYASLTYRGFSAHTNLNKSAYSAYNSLQVDSVFLFRGHGNKSRIAFFTSTGQPNGRIRANTADFDPYYSGTEYAISSLPANALCKAKCVLYVGCSTGLSYNNHNLVQTTFDKGAHFVLGTKKDILTIFGDAWTKCFFQGVKDRAAILMCLRYANASLGTNDIYYVGDVFQIIG